MDDQDSLSVTQEAQLREAVGKLLADASDQRAMQLLAGLLLVSSVAMLAAEKDAGSHIKTFGDALWNALTTVSAVGESGGAPTTPAGRLVGALLMIVGNPLYDRSKATIGEMLGAAVGEPNEPAESQQELLDRLDLILQRLEGK